MQNTKYIRPVYRYFLVDKIQQQTTNQQQSSFEIWFIDHKKTKIIFKS